MRFGRLWNVSGCSPGAHPRTVDGRRPFLWHDARRPVSRHAPHGRRARFHLRHALPPSSTRTPTFMPRGSRTPPCPGTFSTRQSGTSHSETFRCTIRRTGRSPHLTQSIHDYFLAKSLMWSGPAACLRSSPAGTPWTSRTAPCGAIWRKGPSCSAPCDCPHHVQSERRH